MNSKQIKSGKVKNASNKNFTFDGNTIFNPKNPASPARSHLATIFVRQKLGKDRYDKVLKILSESEDPFKLLDITKEISDPDIDPQ